MERDVRVNSGEFYNDVHNAPIALTVGNTFDLDAAIEAEKH